MKDSREYKLRVIWKTMDPKDKVVFLDDSEQYFVPRLKLEKVEYMTYELLLTTSDVYSPVEDCFVDYAYQTSLKDLSNAMCYSNALDKLERYMQDETTPEQTLNATKEKVEYYKNKSSIHINQIKENYGNKQRTIISTLQ